MLLDLRERRGSDERVDRTLSPDQLPAQPDDDYAVDEPVALRLRLLKDGDKFRLRGTVASRLRLSCCRCLESFVAPVDLPLDLMYLPQAANDGEGESEISDEDLSTGFYRNDQIDLAALVREQFQLSLPMKPLCRRRLLWSVPCVRSEPQSRALFVRYDLARSSAGNASGATF